MKKLTLLAVVLVASMLLGNASFAQVSVNTTINATAIVLTNLAFDNAAGKKQDLHFGHVYQNWNKTLSTTGTATPYTGDVSLLSVGKVSVTGASNRGVNYSLTLPANLSDGTNNLPVSFTGSNYAYYSGSLDAANSGANAPDIATSTFEKFLSATGNGYLYIGGTAQPGAAQAASTYTSTITIAIQYSGN